MTDTGCHTAIRTAGQSLTVSEVWYTDGSSSQHIVPLNKLLGTTVLS